MAKRGGNVPLRWLFFWQFFVFFGRKFVHFSAFAGCYGGLTTWFLLRFCFCVPLLLSLGRLSLLGILARYYVIITRVLCNY